MKNKWIWILTVLVLAGFIAGFFLFNQEKAMTMEEAKTLIANRYTGEVINIEEMDGEFIAEMNRDTGKYQVAIDAFNGETRSLEKTGTNENTDTPEKSDEPVEKEILTQQQIKDQLKAAGHEVTSVKSSTSNENKRYVAEVENGEQKSQLEIDAVTGEILKTTPIEETTTKILTEEQAKEIALQTVNGSIDDIDLESINDQPYYLVEIETEDDQEAVVQINAITGKYTISWEED